MKKLLLLLGAVVSFNTFASDIEDDIYFAPDAYPTNCKVYAQTGYSSGTDWETYEGDCHKFYAPNFSTRLDYKGHKVVNGIDYEVYTVGIMHGKYPAFINFYHNNPDADISIEENEDMGNHSHLDVTSFINNNKVNTITMDDDSDKYTENGFFLMYSGNDEGHLPDGSNKILTVSQLP